ncbi:unnamed protein product [Calicophoron daubneyi]|uniref:Uncharacterized protein n=1 Tax=Calicophoron daubneyi TaxID=300641 RepID=A0AAV2SY58_CALDB
MDDCSPDDMGRVTNVYGEDSGADDCEGRLYNEVLSLRRQLEEQKKVTETVKGLAVLENGYFGISCSTFTLLSAPQWDRHYHSLPAMDCRTTGSVHSSLPRPVGEKERKECDEGNVQLRFTARNANGDSMRTIRLVRTLHEESK